ncbi:hypothetical protein MCC01979_19430 [Bifidobacteriaceae bacterium MCC01979]|nr:hypothetical protein MCC01983_17770 [Bifidobacteriaceae bacterium MCC01983]GDZ55093.1 hypothetical protein MCC01979_19430 [Bifidobacteriaceae bacterium MCC01979]
MAIAEAFAKAGYSKASTAGALGVIQFESGMNPEQEQIGETNPALRGFGLNQWTPRSKIQAWMDQHNVSGKDSDADVQIKMLVDTSKSDWNNFYLDNIEAEGYNVTDHDLHKWWLHADNPEDASIAWLAGYGRGAWNDRHEEERKKYARSYYDSPEISAIEFTGKASDDSSGSDNVVQASCSSDDDGDGGSAVVGSVGGAPIGKTRNFGWLCDTDAKVCHDGDYGPFTSFASGGHYQCYWYALVRLWVIHHHDVANWNTPVGGDVHVHLASDPAYTVDSSPHPGDGVSQFGGALGGDMSSGHIAVVEEVKKDANGWRIRISEGNYGTNGSGPWEGYNSRWLTQKQFDGAGNVFFRKKSWKN